MNEKNIKEFLEATLRGEEPRYKQIIIESGTRVSYQPSDQKRTTPLFGSYVVLEARDGLMVTSGSDSFVIPPRSEFYDAAAHVFHTGQGCRLAYQRNAPGLNELLLISIQDHSKVTALGRTHSRL